MWPTSTATTVMAENWPKKASVTAALTTEMMMGIPTAIAARRMARGRAESAKTFPTTEFRMAATVIRIRPPSARQ